MGLMYQKQVKNLPEKYKTFEGDYYYSLTKEEYNSISAP
jgi:hypothetical protein